ncbi:MAG: hypothetical protein B7X72_12070 [Sphingobacteriia bacterium 39-39-8]|nr:MAG: hypothetical protein B7X72_12070 [Sphingobacteriia bacterium 39-39-8]
MQHCINFKLAVPKAPKNCITEMAHMLVELFLPSFDFELLGKIGLLDKLLEIETLNTILKIMVALIAIVVVAVYAILYQKKQRHFKLIAIKELLEPLITTILIEESLASKKILSKMGKIIQDPLARQYCIDELIRCKQNYSGEAAEKMVHLYGQLGLKNYSLKKIQKGQPWYKKARGIQELYMMEQRDCYEQIEQFTNSKDEFVRMEAQIAVVHLIGFKGLQFLDFVSYPITEWQQLKLLEQLKLFPEKSDLSVKIPEWLNAQNHTVVIFALRLTYEYQQLGLTDSLKASLYHPSTEVRSQAVKAIIQLEDQFTPTILLDYFEDASRNDQILILDAMRLLATSEDSNKLESLLDQPDDTIKLKAAAALVHCSKNGIHLLKDKSMSQPEPFQRIFQHIISMP